MKCDYKFNSSIFEIYYLDYLSGREIGDRVVLQGWNKRSKYLFATFDFLKNPTLCESLSKSKKTTISRFYLIEDGALVYVTFAKKQRMFGGCKTFITIGNNALCEKTMEIKKQSMSELNEWINVVIKYYVVIQSGVKKVEQHTADVIADFAMNGCEAEDK